MNEPEMMDPFEEELTRALRRVEAPASLADSVMRALAGEAERQQPDKRPKSRLLAFVKPRARVDAQRGAPARAPTQVWMGAAIAAMLVLTAVGGERVHQERERAALAQREYETATHITDRALEHAREQLQSKGISLDQ